MNYPSQEELLAVERNAQLVRNQELARLFRLLWNKIAGLFRSDEMDGAQSASA